MAESERVRAWIALAQGDPQAYGSTRLTDLGRAADLVGSCFQAEAHESLKAMELEGESVDHSFQLGPTALMLIGYAIEVVAKGLIVAANAEAPKNISQRHISVELLEDARVEFCGGEKVLVDQTLYHAVRWFGGYPVPRPTR